MFELRTSTDKLLLEFRQFNNKCQQHAVFQTWDFINEVIASLLCFQIVGSARVPLAFIRIDTCTFCPK